jgi:phosphoenolpyruvate synthase/pyruvate phosphate dikinase
VGYVVDLAEIEQTQVAEVGGKGANLGELGRIDGIRVPPGFCVTAGAFRRIVAGAPALDVCSIGWWHCDRTTGRRSAR